MTKALEVLQAALHASIGDKSTASFGLAEAAVVDAETREAACVQRGEDVLVASAVFAIAVYDEDCAARRGRWSPSRVKLWPCRHGLALGWTRDVLVEHDDVAVRIHKHEACGPISRRFCTRH